MPSTIQEYLSGTAETLARLVENSEAVETAAQKIYEALRAGKKVVAFGNGGSAADAQHFVAELVGRFEAERPGLPAIALTTNTSILTAVGNDYGYELVFSRQVQPLVQAGDVVVGISTSGNAGNVIAAVEQARKQKAFTIGLTGAAGGKLKSAVDCCISVPSNRTSHIQEGHIAAIHAMCARIDQVFAAAKA
jgi:D-sedoheptulose 7-phosphate isomerase